MRFGDGGNDTMAPDLSNTMNVKWEEACATVERAGHAETVHVLFIATRPCYIKLASVVDALHRSGLPFLVVETGQHYEQHLTSAAAEFGYQSRIAINLSSRGSLTEQVCALTSAVTKLRAVLHRRFPRQRFVPIVSGDTIACLAITQAWYMDGGGRSMHIEAGLRSFSPFRGKDMPTASKVLNQVTADWLPIGDEPFPEHMDSRVASIFSKRLYAPVVENRMRLIEEGIAEDRIQVTGSLSSDAVCTVFRSMPDRRERSENSLMSGSGQVVRIDLHRRENMTPDRIIAVCNAAVRLAETGFRVLFVMTNQINAFACRFGFEPFRRLTNAGVSLIDMNSTYADLLHLLKSPRCAGVLTDSGGLQEECQILGTSCLILRSSTDRPEAVLRGQGTHLLVPPIDGQLIYEVSVLHLVARQRNSFDLSIYGEAVGQRIVADLLRLT